MNRSRWIWTSALLLAAGAASAQHATRRSYIVQLDELPVAGYTGQVQGYAATKPTAGRKLDMRASTVQAYVNYLNNRQAAVLSGSGLAGVPVTHRYRVAFPGFAARLTDAEVVKLAASAGVRAITPDRMHSVDTSRTPGFLGLSAPGGLWSQGFTGENIVIGIIDTGISPENPAFSDKVDSNGKPIAAQQAGTLAYQPITNFRPWNGTCQAGAGFAATDCNNKLIGARSFSAGMLNTGVFLTATEYDSPRDGDGHGSHTGSTAGGNKGVAAVVNGATIGVISGMAPRARVASYKALWHYQDANGNTDGLANGVDSDLIDAIDAAVADGVDVINYSISGTLTDYLSPDEVAFFFAADAGVFVAASAGNSGPGNAVAHMSPWLTTVAASTHDRLMVATAKLGNDAQYTGVSFQLPGVATSTLILSTDAGLTGADATAVRLCFAAVDNSGVAVLDPAKIAGKIVVCDRGSNARVNKSLAVGQAGGAGMLLLNTSAAADGLVGDIHSVPTVHLPLATRTAIRSYAATAGATASISPSFNAPGVIAPQMADFSSRGPSLASPNILKPDITAPGVDVLAALAHLPANAAEQAAVVGGAYPPAAFGFASGTSMSSPHIAGIAAVLRQAHPGWSPAAIKSAMMTTATNVLLADGSRDPDRFGYGAGHVNPNGATAVGLVYDAGSPDYLAFLCGQGLLAPTSNICNAFGLLPSWNLNLPSLTSQVVGTQTLWRTVTNVGNGSATYTASAAAAGYTVSVSPSSLTLAPGEQGSFALTAKRSDAPLGSWVFGNLDWSDGSQTVRSPLTLQALAMAAPAEIDDNRARANRLFTVATGYDGTMRSSTAGLVPATRTAGTVALNQHNCSATVAVPAGAGYLRVALFNRDSTGQGKDDLDLRVLLNGTEVGSSGGSTADELVHLPNPAAGSYSVCVDGFAPFGGSSNYTLSTWVGTATNALPNALRVITPSKVVTGGTGSVSFTWLATVGNRYFATVNYLDGNNARVGQTNLFVDTVAPLAGAAAAPNGVNPFKAAAKAASLAAK